MTGSKKIVILGSTGSIGQQSIDVIKGLKSQFEIVGLSARSNADLLIKQARTVGAKRIALLEKQEHLKKLHEKYDKELEIMTGLDGISSLCRKDDVDIVLNAIVGSIGLRPTLTTLENGKVLCLANKESLVVGGELVLNVADRNSQQIIPIDSEHSAIFQCLKGQNIDEVKQIIITASGGPFFGKEKNELENIKVDEALAHPRWEMGPKITIDSATMMNKGLEVIEAHFLFGVSYDRIKVVIHQQSIVHSLVEFNDGSFLAQLGPTDMRIPIQYALTYPERENSSVSSLEIGDLEDLTFDRPDYEAFPCLSYCYEAGRAGKTYPAVLNASNEEAVQAFLDNRIGFLDISRIVREALDKHIPENVDSIVQLEEAEKWARNKALQEIEIIQSKGNIWVT